MQSTFVSTVTCVRHRRVSHYRVVATFQEVFDPLMVAPILFNLLESVMIEKLGSETELSLDEPEKTEPPANPPERVIDGVSLWFTTYFIVKVRVRSKPTGNAEHVCNVFVETSSTEPKNAAKEIAKSTIAAHLKMAVNEHWEAIAEPTWKKSELSTEYETSEGRAIILEYVKEA